MRNQLTKTSIHSATFDGVILAAGLSTRFPPFKLEMPVCGIPIINRMIECMGKACNNVIVVGGYQIERLRELTSSYPFVRVVFNPLYSTGMFSSVKEGLRHVLSQWFFFSPGDYPFVNPSTLSALRLAMNENPDKSVFIPVLNGRKGHPILLNRDIIPAILEEPDDSNLKIVLNRKTFCPVQVNDEGILLDIDSIKDYEKISASIKSRYY